MPTEMLLNPSETPTHTKPALIQRIRIRGYKSIEFCDVALHPLTILVGRNSAGKSNFLDALGFISELMDRRASEVVNDRRGWRAIHCQGSNRGDIEFRIECDFTSDDTHWVADYGFSIILSKDNQIRIVREHLVMNDGSRKFGYRVTEGVASWYDVDSFNLDVELLSNGKEVHPASAKLDSPQLYNLLRHDRLLLSVMSTQPFVDLADKLRTSRIYNFAPDKIRVHQPVSSTPILNREGANLARAIDGIREVSSDDVERIKSYLREIVPDVQDFRKQTYGDYETLRFVMKSATGKPSQEFDASSMSDGTLRVLAALVAVFQYSPPIDHPGFIGIEEPETALHPAAMRALVDAIDEATQRTQILLTTHSADLLLGRDITPGQVLVVRNREGKTQITPLDRASQEILKKELYTLGDLQRMDKLDLDEADLRRQAELNRTGD